MAMELVLLEEVAGLGKIGAKVRVADGYARNFLIPRKLATPVTPGALRAIEARRVREEKTDAERKAAAEALAEQIGKLSVTLPMQAAEDDKLYGSVQAHQILEAAAKEGLALDKTQLSLPEPIKALGVYSLEVRLHPEVTATLKVWVVRQERATDQ